MNKNYTNIKNNGTVWQIIDNTLTNTMENIIIRNNDKGKSNISSQMKEDLAAKPRHLIQVVN